MLNAKLIGSYISNMRKNKNMTQVELAEKVSVTHQAVSKWERGESLPDLGVLVELAPLFDCSVDHLLNGGTVNRGNKGIGALAEMVSDQRHHEAAGIINNGEAEPDALATLGPVIKPDALKDVTQLVSESVLHVNNLVALAPFLDNETLTAALQKTNQESITKGALLSLAPFMKSSMVDEWATLHSGSLNEVDILNLAPFMEDALDQVVHEKEWSRVDKTTLVSLAPFVKGETLAHLLEASQEELPLESLMELAPFLDKHLDGILLQCNLKEITWSKVDRLAPFIEKETLINLVNSLPKEDMTNEDLRRLAPFLDEQLDSLVIDAKLSADQIVELAPFLSRNTLKALIERGV